MMLALGLGGWLAGMFHLFTHAFFKALLFLCSGSVIHATGTNEMPAMGGLRKKMPWTAGTMLVGCLAISGAGIPLVVGLSGYYSKDGILAQALAFKEANPLYGYFFWIATAGAAITAFYMFRLWYMTFAGEPRDEHVYHHAHESPWVMVGPLVILAFFAIVAGWGTKPGLLPRFLEQARPLGTEHGASAGWPSPIVPVSIRRNTSRMRTAYTYPPRCGPSARRWPVSCWRPCSTGCGNSTRTTCGNSSLPSIDSSIHKWWFDELYAMLFVRPTLQVSNWVAACDKLGIDRAVDGLAWLAGVVARLDEWIDRIFIDGLVDGLASMTYAAGLRLRAVQSGNLRQYVLWIAVGTVALVPLDQLLLELGVAWTT